MAHQPIVATGNPLLNKWSGESVEIQYDSVVAGNSVCLVPMHSFVVVCMASICFALTLSHFLTREILQRDAVLTSRLVSNIASGHGQQAELAKILDERTDLIGLGITTATAEAVKRQFYDHLQFLPDMLHANVYAADRKLIWASNSELIGKEVGADMGLGKAIITHSVVTQDFNQENHNVFEQMLAQWFTANSQEFFVKNYIPLLDADDNVIAVVEIYKEPKSLLDSIKNGYLMVWGCTTLTIVLVYLAMFPIVRRNKKIEEVHPQQYHLELE